jgi:hypothetical protein
MRVCYPVIRNRHGAVVWSGLARCGDSDAKVEQFALDAACRAESPVKFGTPGILWADSDDEIAAGRYFVRVTDKAVSP